MAVKEYNLEKDPKNKFRIIKETALIKDVLTEFQDALPILKTSEEYRESMSEKFSRYAYFLVLQSNNENSGFCAFYANDSNTKTAYISFIAVADKFRGQHFGKQILEKVISISREAGMEFVKLEVLKTNIVAQNFYIRNGFKILEDASDNSIYMIKSIMRENNATFVEVVK